MKHVKWGAVFGVRGKGRGGMSGLLGDWGSPSSTPSAHIEMAPVWIHRLYRLTTYNMISKLRFTLNYKKDF